MITISVPGASLHVLDEGASDGPPVVLLHAGIADSRAWDDFAPLVAADIGLANTRLARELAHRQPGGGPLQ